MKKNITIIAAIAVSCTASFILGHAWSGPNTPSVADQPNILKGPRALDDELQGLNNSGHFTASRKSRSGHDFAQMPHYAQSILSNSDAVARAKTWATFVNRLDAGSFEDTANRFLQGGYLQTRKNELSLLMSAWAKQDPLSALAYADREMQNQGSSLHRAALASWAATDPKAAIDYAKNQSNSMHASSCLLGVIEGLAETDPARATELIAELSSSPDRHKALLALQSHYLMKGPEAARNWAMGMEDPSLRSLAINQVTRTLAMSDPSDAVDWLMENSDRVPSHAISIAMAEMAKADPSAATAYLKQFEGDVATHACMVGGITAGLTKSDPQAALDFLEANPSPANDFALMALTMKTAQSSPEVSAAAADQIKDPALQSIVESGFKLMGSGDHLNLHAYDPVYTFGEATDDSTHGTNIGMYGDSIILMQSDSQNFSFGSPSSAEPEE